MKTFAPDEPTSPSIAHQPAASTAVQPTAAAFTVQPAPTSLTDHDGTGTGFQQPTIG